MVFDFFKNQKTSNKAEQAVVKLPFCELAGDQSGKGQLPLEVSSVESLGNVYSNNTYVNRDLGFHGQLGETVILTYGDTMWSDSSHSEKWRGMTSDSAAFATAEPLQVQDFDLNDQGYPQQFCPLLKEYGEDLSEDAIGITNVIETSPGQGILFFLKNHRPGGNNTMVGAGVATVTLSEPGSGPPVPKCTRLGEYWWDATKEPWYGDVCALKAGDHVYAYGHAQAAPYVYVCRVRCECATDLSQYEYWNGENWQKERLYNPGEKEGVWWQINQGQVIWSNYYGCFIFIFVDNWMNSKVQAKVSYSPQGPWSDPVELYQATPITKGGAIYAAIPHPYYDDTGKTLVITFTNAPNVIQAIRVTFK